MLVIAHRGANREALENSWTAFEKAIEAGAARIELDVQASRDGHLVINHDDSLFHTTSKPLVISAMDRRELEGIRLRNGEPIPFLDQVLPRLLPRIELNVEIKSADPYAADLVIAQIRRYHSLGRIIVSSFQPSCLMHIANTARDITLACLWCHELYWPNVAYYAPNIFMAQTGARIFHPEASLVTEEMMDYARHKAWTVYPWVTMDGEENKRIELWTYLKTLGVDGLCTNYPRELIAWLKDADVYDHAIAL